MICPVLLWKKLALLEYKIKRQSLFTAFLLFCLLMSALVALEGVWFGSFPMDRLLSMRAVHHISGFDLLYEGVLILIRLFLMFGLPAYLLVRTLKGRV